MRIINGRHNAQKINGPVAATIGNFDGVHLGHQALLGHLKTVAAQSQKPAMLITFEPSPQEFFLGDNAPGRLTRLREKLRLLQELDYVVMLPFNHSLAQQSAEQFVRYTLQQELQVDYLLVGDDFHFGKNRLGNFALLKSMADKQRFVVEKTKMMTVHGERISSSRIRTALQNGDLVTAQRLLGRPYCMLGRIVQGQQRGRTIGFPTANVFLQRHRSPILGVYAVKVHGLAKDAFYGVANVGNRPTVGGTRSLLEIHLFDFYEDIYGKYIKVEFCHKIRDEKRFASFAVLKKQITIDAQQARVFFALEQTQTSAKN